MRVRQSVGDRGSLKWIQLAVNRSPDRMIDRLILPRLDKASSITWLSPLAEHDFAEYGDAAFLDLIGARHLSDALADFWPRRGPQWDALGRSDAGDILLVEAKAHFAEICSPGSQASSESRKKLEKSLSEVVAHLGANPRAPWSNVFYQLANRIAGRQ